MDQPPTANDLMCAAMVLRDTADGEPQAPMSEGHVRVATALEMLAPFVQHMEQDPGNVQPLVQLLLTAQEAGTTEQEAKDAASQNNPEEA